MDVRPETVTPIDTYEIVVVGCGMAGLAASIRSAERGTSVAVREKSPEEKRGGQTRFTESFRVPSADTDLTERGCEFDISHYTVDEFHRDVMSQTNAAVFGRRAGERAVAYVD